MHNVLQLCRVKHFSVKPFSLQPFDRESKPRADSASVQHRAVCPGQLFNRDNKLILNTANALDQLFLLNAWEVPSRNKSNSMQGTSSKHAEPLTMAPVLSSLIHGIYLVSRATHTQVTIIFYFWHCSGDQLLPANWQYYFFTVSLNYISFS